MPIMKKMSLIVKGIFWTHSVSLFIIWLDSKKGKGLLKKNNFKNFRKHWLNNHWTVISTIVFIIFCGAVLLQYLLFTLRRQPLFKVCNVFRMGLDLRLVVKWMWMNRLMYRTNSCFLCIDKWINVAVWFVIIITI